MSRPTKDTIWGSLIYEEQEFKVLGGYHLTEELNQKIHSYREKRNPLIRVLSPIHYWLQWEVIDSKLYLVDIELFGIAFHNAVDKENMHPEENTGVVQKIFGTDRMFAKWVNEPIKLLIKKSKQKHFLIHKGTRWEKMVHETTMDLLILEFEEGILKSTKHEEETFRGLKNYLEEEE